jgi:hypothetical protein
MPDLSTLLKLRTCTKVGAALLLCSSSALCCLPSSVELHPQALLLLPMG